MAKEAFKLMPGEREVFDGSASKVGFFGGGGGKLVLTTHRLVYANRRKTRTRLQIPLSEIIHVGKSSGVTIWTAVLLVTFFMKNAIRITVQGGRSHRFVAHGLDRWVDLIGEYRRKAQV